MSQLLDEVTDLRAVNLTDAEVESLGEHGAFVRNAFLGRSLARQVHRAAQAWLEEGRFRPAGIRRGAQHLVDDTIRQDQTVFLDESTAEPALASALGSFSRLMQAINRAAYMGLRRMEVQLAHYPATGAKYDRHRDAFPGEDNRRVTAIVYLNEPWQPPHGGYLRLYTQPMLDIPPSLDRLVVFRSEVVEHEVLATFASRFALTAWYSAR